MNKFFENDEVLSEWERRYIVNRSFHVWNERSNKTFKQLTWFTDYVKKCGWNVFYPPGSLFRSHIIKWKTDELQLWKNQEREGIVQIAILWRNGASEDAVINTLIDNMAYIPTMTKPAEWNGFLIKPASNASLQQHVDRIMALILS